MERNSSPIRPAEERDVSRIAEILIFSKRVNYRRIFHNDEVSFGEMQVLPLALSLIEDRELLGRYLVYDDGFVKGLVRTEGDTVQEIYVDPFFTGQGIGGKLLEYAVHKGARTLWVLERNTRAIAFYERHGFAPTGERAPEGDTGEHIVRMSRPGCG